MVEIKKIIKVLIVDDSALIRKILTEELSQDPCIEVVGTAPDPYIARDKILQYKPDLLILDIEMPKMYGLTFLEILMKNYPIPVIILSSLAKAGSEVTMRALELGALGVIAKPGSSYTVKEVVDQLLTKIKEASNINNIKPEGKTQRNYNTPSSAILKTTTKIIAIGASTGGTEAIKDVLQKLPAIFPPILIVQHMPQAFTKSFAERLDSICNLYVKEAEDKEPATPGKVLVAPGNKHMVLKRSGANYYVEIKDGPFVFHQRPSVEVLFESVAKYAGKNSIGVILTGMGKDGAKGLYSMKTAGAYTIAQDEESCVVFGMPKEAILMDAVHKIAALDNIPKILLDLVE